MEQMVSKLPRLLATQLAPLLLHISAGAGDKTVAGMTGHCAFEDTGSGAPILGTLGVGSSASGCFLKAKGGWLDCA